MKKLSLVSILIVSFCLFVFNGCGLETIYYLNAPFKVFDVNQVTNANYTSQTDADLADFEFESNNSQPEDVLNKDMYSGTAVYYRIYNNYETMNSQISSLSSLSTSSNSASSATSMISYGYKELGFAYENEGNYVSLGLSPLHKYISGAADVRIAIRLTNNTDYDACVKIFISEGVYQYWMYNVTTKSIVYCDTLEQGYAAGYKKIIPMRRGGDKNFDFGRKYSSGEKKLPESGDDDYNYSTSTSAENMFYVTLYAVACGFDSESFVDQYSGVLYLGSVAIDASLENN